MKARMITLYAVLLVIGFLLLAMIWHWQMAGTYFISRDRGIILDFVPPFARPGTSGDFYLKPQRVVYTIWCVYVAAGLILPAIGAWFFVRLYQKDLETSWR
jgi:hypothetical protein